jgi:pyrroline-5-carboxylate reductase
MEKRIGFIGCGKMAKAMLQGMISSSTVLEGKIMASAATHATLKRVEEQFGIYVTDNNLEVAQFADILFLAVKPDHHAPIIKEIRQHLSPKTIVVTIAAGISLSFLESQFGKEIKLIRAMPNTPSLVGKGMSALCPNNRLTAEEINEVLHLFESFGKAELIEEKLMDAIPAISGSSPAYVYMFIEALADGAVRQGIPREKAYRLAAQSVLGAAAMIMETGIHPGELKDQVCTPGGATIEAVAALEREGFRASVLSAMESCTEKVISLSLQNKG